MLSARGESPYSNAAPGAKKPAATNAVANALSQFAVSFVRSFVTRNTSTPRHAHQFNRRNKS